MRIFPDGAKKKPADNFAEAKRPGSRRLLAAKCVPGRNSNSHFLQGALKKTRRRFRRKNTPGFRGGFSGEMCTRPQSKFALAPRGAKKKPMGRFRYQKNGIIPGFFGGELSAGSQSKFAFSSGGSNEKNRRPRRKNAPGFQVFVFAAKFAPCRNSNFISPQREIKKTQRWFRRRKKNSGPLGFFLRRSAF